MLFFFPSPPPDLRPRHCAPLFPSQREGGGGGGINHVMTARFVFFPLFVSTFSTVLWWAGLVLDILGFGLIDLIRAVPVCDYVTLLGPPA